MNKFKRSIKIYCNTILIVHRYIKKTNILKYNSQFPKTGNNKIRRTYFYNMKTLV